MRSFVFKLLDKESVNFGSLGEEPRELDTPKGVPLRGRERDKGE